MVQCVCADTAIGHIYLIRHAQPTLPGVFLGRTDSPLSAAGHAEAGRDLSHLRPSAVYSSPLSRAVESAQYKYCA